MTADKTTEKALRGAVPNVDSSGLIAEFGRRAEAEGLIEVAFAYADTPHGKLLLAATDVGLVRTGLPAYPHDGILEELAFEVSPRVVEQRSRLDLALREVDAYFEGKLRAFSMPLDLRLMRGWQTDVLRVTAEIPYGGTLSYGEVAAEAGRPKAYRAAGSALGRNPIPLIVPCHRVLKSGGKVGNYGGGPEMKRALLKHEGALPPTP